MVNSSISLASEPHERRPITDSNVLIAHHPPPPSRALSRLPPRKPPLNGAISDNGGGTGSSYAIIKGDISTLYKDMSYLKSCKLTSPSASPQPLVLAPSFPS